MSSELHDSITWVGRGAVKGIENIEDGAEHTSLRGASVLRTRGSLPLLSVIRSIKSP